jgi:NTE family protein
MENSVADWIDEFASQNHQVNIFLIYLDFDDIADTDRRRYFHGMATSFALPSEEVDSLIAAGRELLRDSPEFRRFVESLARPEH